MTVTPALEIRNLSVSYGQNLVLSNTTLAIPTGVAAAIVGPNGAGKTTLLKASLGLVPIQTGEILIRGQSYDKNRAFVAYVPQRSSIDWDFPTTVFDVVLMGTYGKLSWYQRPGRLEKSLAEKALSQLGISDLASRQIGELSGGQQQRTFLARALAQDASILLLDEPLQGVDMTTEKVIIDVLHQLRKQGRTIIAVHHDLSTIAEYFDWIAFVNGQVMASGPTKTCFTDEQIRKVYTQLPR
jgi:manganese/zinc/iron transport system ATP- binding protein